jgi:hypothetical protein
MLGLDMLDVAIGLVFVYLMLSFVASAAAEMLEVALRHRPKKLLLGIRELLQSDTLVQKLYDHPLVNALYQGGFMTNKPRNLPAYIPSKNFALALLSILPIDDAAPAAASEIELLRSRVDAIATEEERGLAEAFRHADETLADPNATADKKAAADAAKQLRKMKFKALLNPTERKYLAIAERVSLQRALLSLIAAEEKDTKKTVQNIEEWYNSAMDRVSGWFKRRAQIILFLIGLFFAVILNVDSMYVMQRLSGDKSMRNAVVAAATERVKTPIDSTAPPDDVKTANDHLQINLQTLNKLGLPIGWDNRAAFRDLAFTRPKEGETVWNIGPLQNMTSTEILRMLLGWLMTACAVSLGAPFWFDMLNKIIVVRSTVKPEEKSGKEASKDPQKSKS